jgi:hypothetical protein
LGESGRIVRISSNDFERVFGRAVRASRVGRLAADKLCWHGEQ